MRWALACLLALACAGEPPRAPTREELLKTCPQAAQAMLGYCVDVAEELCPLDAGSLAECPRADEAQERCGSEIDRILAEECK